MSTFALVAGTAVLFWGLTMLAIIDIILKDFGSITTKAMWGFISMIPFVGWLIYLVFGYRKGTRKNLSGPTDNH
ncbi:MAG: PLDc N-terminal domain-containing protein [Pseudomonadota bacterium]